MQTSLSINYAYIGTIGVAADINYFYDCFRGIEINNYWMTFIHNNDFICSSTPAVVTGNTIANIAVYTRNIKEKVEIIDNDMTNWINAAWIHRNTAGGGLLNPTLDVNNNSINANASGYCSQAVLLQDLSGNTITTVQPMYIRNNTITDVNNGIRATYIKNNLVIYNNPTIALRYTASGVFAGIRLEGCDKAEIKNNNVSSLRIPYGSGDNWDLRGIYVKTSTNNKVFCNTLNYLGQCMVFEGNCLSTSNSSYGSTTNGILGNAMDNARTGLMLRLSGVIGQQGASTFPSSNTWNNAYTFTDGRTHSYSTSGSSNVNTASKLYCLIGGGTFPPLGTNYTNGLTGTEYSAASGGLNIATGSAITCPTTYVPAGLIVNNNGTRFMDAGEVAYAEELKTLLTEVLADAAFSSSSWMMQQFIFNEVKEHSGLLGDSLLNAFYSANQTNAFGLFHTINDSIEAGNYAQAAIDNSNVNPVNIIEENQKTFNSIYLANHDSLEAYTSTDSTTLYSIASQCAVEGGDAVYQSRSLLMFMANSILEFSDPCDASIEDEVDEARSVNIQDVHNIKLYPNPNSGTMILQCNLAENESGSVKIYDLAGRLIIIYNLEKDTKEFSIDARSLNAGMYVYEVSVNGKLIKKDRLSIIK